MGSKKTEEARNESDFCPAEVWDSVSTGMQPRVPKTIEELWSQWADFAGARSRLDTLLMNGKVADNVRVTRVSIAQSNGDEPSVLVILDGYRGKTKVAAFYRGPDAFRATMMAIFRAMEGLAEWKVRTGASRKAESEEPSPYGSSAF